VTTRADVVAEARRWIDTPFHHQARTRGVGCDCGGLVGGIAVALRLVPLDWWERSFDPAFGGYARQPSQDRLRQICLLFMDRLEPGSEQPGDVVLIDFGVEPQHLGVLADYRHGGLSIVHAMARPPRVAEHRLDPRWRDRVVDAFAYRMD
jgi:NlpC/P60 family putative phage cell wall peptidase